MKTHQLLVIAGCALTAPASALAGDIITKTADVESANSINLSPLGVLSGSYGLNYERLMGGYHGLIAEATFQHSSNDDASSTGGGLRAGYRFHWRGQQNSGFVGLMVGYSMGTADATVQNTGGMMKTFDVDAKVLEVTANIGKRWTFNDFNLTFRVGAGWGKYDITTDSTDPDAQAAVNLVDDLLTFLPVAFDGELSLGYAF